MKAKPFWAWLFLFMDLTDEKSLYRECNLTPTTLRTDVLVLMNRTYKL
jgi:hypothetical protein